MNLFARRGLETLGMLMIGDGVLAMVEPGRHARLWRSGPSAWADLMRYFERRPLLTAGLGAVEVAAGFWLARRQSRGS